MISNVFMFPVFVSLVSVLAMSRLFAYIFLLRAMPLLSSFVFTTGFTPTDNGELYRYWLTST